MKRTGEAFLVLLLALAFASCTPQTLSIPRADALPEFAEAAGYTPFLPTDWGMPPEEVLSVLGWSGGDWTEQEASESGTRFFISRDRHFIFRFKPYPISGKSEKGKKNLDVGLTSVLVLCKTQEEIDEIQNQLNEKFSPPQGQRWIMGPLENEHPGFSEYCRILKKWYQATGIPSGERDDFAETLKTFPLSTATLVTNPALLGEEDIAGYFEFSGETCAVLNHIDAVAAEWELLIDG